MTLRNISSILYEVFIRYDAYMRRFSSIERDNIRREIFSSIQRELNIYYKSHIVYSPGTTTFRYSLFLPAGIRERKKCLVFKKITF